MMSKTLRLSDGSTVRVLEAGAGEPLLLIHGVGLRAEAWAPQMRLEAHVFAVDLPGHGDSTPLPAGARLPDYVAWAAQVIEALGVGPMNVAGHSMGSLIAGGLAIERPDLVKRVALLNGVHRRTPEARAAVLGRAAEIAAGRTSVTARALISIGISRVKVVMASKIMINVSNTPATSNSPRPMLICRASAMRFCRYEAATPPSR